MSEIEKIKEVKEEDLKKLLSDTSTLINHQRELDDAKGERFNLFSILKMETKENGTHSAFLGELLNPDGSHLKGNLFLNLFLKQIKSINSKVNINIESAKVELEYHISEVDLEAETETGGRIDIYISDKNRQTLSIENKIYAPDQEAQVIRYCNYNKKNNIVFYLTLEGKEASEDSIKSKKDGKTLKANKDYFLLSYKEDIVEWLQKCLKESAEFPILRESIKQYIILIQRLTYTTMDDKDLNELRKLILNNLEAANYIANNSPSIKRDIGNEIRTDVYNKLNMEYEKSNITIEWGEENKERSKNLELFARKYKEGSREQFYFEIIIESFRENYKYNEGNLFIGILCRDGNGKESDYYSSETSLKNGSEYFPKISTITFDGDNINFTCPDLLKKIISSEEKSKQLVMNIVDQSKEFIDTILKKNK
jgi:hypothetical protein